MTTRWRQSRQTILGLLKYVFMTRPIFSQYAQSTPNCSVSSVISKSDLCMSSSLHCCWNYRFFLDLVITGPELKVSYLSCQIIRAIWCLMQIFWHDMKSLIQINIYQHYQHCGIFFLRRPWIEISSCCCSSCGPSAMRNTGWQTYSICTAVTMPLPRERNPMQCFTDPSHVKL